MVRSVSSDDVLKALKEAGFTFVSQKGSHMKLQDASGRTAIVPHPKKDLPIGTVKSI
jgi:predicted RNA binding protein YcfA (HicA-like mRNA interferase family)